MAKTCIFCGEELSLLNRGKLYSFGTEQPVCKACYNEMVQLDAHERGRRALATGRAEDADVLREQLALQQAREDAKRASRISDKTCPHCGVPMVKLGRQQFQLGEHSLLWGDLAHLAAGSLTLDLVCCEQCRKVEFFHPEDFDPKQF